VISGSSRLCLFVGGSGHSPFNTTAGVRIPVGTSKFDEASRNSENIEEFVTALRFEHRGKLELVPINNIKSQQLELTARIILWQKTLADRLIAHLSPPL
jgi:hypothetical protein